jgi:hypothetical protein
MSSARQATPLFLSSSRDISNDTDETSFTCRLTPPLRISEQAKKVSAYIDSATIPYTFPNLDSSTSSVVVRIPLRNPSNPSADSGEVTLSLQTGVFNLTEVAEQVNQAVNTWLHTNGYPVLTGSWEYYNFSTDSVATKASAANFCSLIPNFHKNRIELLLNYDNSEIDFADTDTTLDDLLGFTTKCRRTLQAQVVIPVGGYTIHAAFCTTPSGGSGNVWQNVNVVVREGTYSATSLCTEINTVFVSAVQARTDENKDSPRIAAATASGPLIASISLEPSYEIEKEYRAEIELTNFVTPGNLPAGASMFGQFDAVGVSILTVTQNTAFTNLLGTLAYSQWPGTDLRTLATMWSGAQATPFVAENAATIDKVTEVGISAPGLAHGSYSADGSSAGATLARFQVTGGPGSNMVFRPPNPIKVDISHLIGGTVEQIKLMLVDQHGKQISSLLGEKFSCVLVIDSE